MGTGAKGRSVADGKCALPWRMVRKLVRIGVLHIVLVMAPLVGEG